MTTTTTDRTATRTRTCVSGGHSARPRRRPTHTYHWQTAADARIQRCVGCGRLVYGEGLCADCRAEESGL